MIDIFCVLIVQSNVKKQEVENSTLRWRNAVSAKPRSANRRVGERPAVKRRIGGVWFSNLVGLNMSTDGAIIEGP